MEIARSLGSALRIVIAFRRSTALGATRRACHHPFRQVLGKGPGRARCNRLEPGLLHVRRRVPSSPGCKEADRPQPTARCNRLCWGLLRQYGGTLLRLCLRVSAAHRTIRQSAPYLAPYLRQKFGTRDSCHVPDAFFTSVQPLFSRSRFAVSAWLSGKLGAGSCGLS